MAARRGERAQSLAEMARVFKPGSRVLIADIEHQAEYIARLVALGFVGARHEASPLAEKVAAIIHISSLELGATFPCDHYARLGV